MAKKILIVCTSCDRLGTASDAPPTGCWAEELAAPYYLFKEKGYDITVASIKGGKIPFDEVSLNPPFVSKDTERMLLDTEAMRKVVSSVSITDVDATSFDAVYLPGGHGTCWDLPEDEALIKQLSAAYSAGKIVSALCHGVGGLVNIKSANGEHIVKGKKVTGFSDSEEIASAKQDVVPFLLETKLREIGGVYQKGDDWHPYAVRDGNLITGQNPQSSTKAAELIIEALS